VSYKLSGINPLAYMGVEPNSPAQTVVFDFAPTVNDTNFNLGTLWLDTADQVPWELVSLANGTAVWISLGGGAANLQTLSADGPTVVNPTAGNINIFGGTGITTTGTTSTITLNVTNPVTFPITVAEGGTGDASFTPYAVLTGGTTSTGPIQSIASVGTSGEVLTSNGAGALPTFQAAAVSGASTFITDSGNATETGGNISILGDGTNIGTAPAGVGNHEVKVSFGGITQYSLAVGTSTTNVAPLGVATNGQLPIGSTGANPVLSTITPGTGITVGNAAGSITISSTNVNPAATCAFSAYNSTDRSSFGTAGTFSTVPFDTELFDLGSNYNTGTNQFTAPATGYYNFVTNVAVDSVASTVTEFSVQLLVSGTSAGAYLQPNGNLFSQTQTGGAGSWGQSSSYFVKMTIGDTAVLQFLQGPSSTSLVTIIGNGLGAQFRTSFCGYRVA
jgi:hypothetical protein